MLTSTILVDGDNEDVVRSRRNKSF